MKFPKPHDDAVRNAVMISGIFRSGTTILGKIIGSFKNAEYSHEAPLMFHLDYLVQENKINAKTAAEILRTYFAEDIMFNFHHGRNYNIREMDDSCIYKMKTKEEVEKRWKEINNVREAVALMKELNSRLVFKSPAVYAIIPVLLKNFEGLKVIEIQRDLKAILSSVIVKNWFTNEELSQEDYLANYPYISDNNPIHVPYYMDKEKVNEWRAANEETKVVQILNRLVEKRLEMQKLVKEKYPGRYLVVKYEEILESPEEQVKKIAGFLGMQLTEKTKELISLTKPTKRAYDAEEILKKTNKEDADAFLKNNKLLGY